MKLFNYIKTIFVNIYRLLQGMGITLRNMFRKKVTESYPENRGVKQPFERTRSRLIMPHDSNNQHQCTACLICMNNCPNGTIAITTKKEIDPETGKERKVLDKYSYDLGSCTFCSICTMMCPSDAIAWSQDFENAVFTRARLIQRLNAEGSSLKKKEKPAPKVEAPQPTEPKPTDS